MFVANGFEWYGHFAYPIIVTDFSFRIPFVIPVQGKIFGIIPTIRNKSFPLHTKRVDTKLKCVRPVFIGVQSNRKRVVRFSPKVPTQRGRYIFSGTQVVHDGKYIDKMVVIRHAHFGRHFRIGRVEGEILLELVSDFGCLPVSLIHFAIYHYFALCFFNMKALRLQSTV